MFSDQKALESTSEVGDHNARVQWWLELSPRLTTHLSTERAASTEMLRICPVCERLPRNKTAVGLAASTSSIPASPASPVLRRRPVLAWVGWCLASTMLFWVGYLSHSRIPAIFAHTGHVSGNYDISAYPGDSSLVYLLLSPPSPSWPSQKNHFLPMLRWLRVFAAPLEDDKGSVEAPAATQRCRTACPSHNKLFTGRTLSPRSLIRPRPLLRCLATRRP